MATEQAKAKTQLDRMRRSLKTWLEYRDLNDKAGATDYDQADRAQFEPILNVRLRELMRQLYGAGVVLPSDLRSLAQLVVDGTTPETLQAPAIWPLLIMVGAALLLLAHTITSYADVAKERERIRCIEKGACTDYGFWFKWGAILVGGYVVWTKLGVGDEVKKLIGAAGHRARRRLQG